MNKMQYPVPPLLAEIAAVFTNAGFQVYLVGGSVRDYLLKKAAHDWDLATDASPEKVRKLFKHTIPTGIKHGTITILYKGKSIECTTFRTEADYTDSRHPDAVNYARSIEEDLSRRDFTINAFAVKLPEGRITDLFNGMRDLRKKIIRTVGNPLERFSEDGLRPIRAIRFAAQLDFSIEPETLKAIPLSIAKIKTISVERFQDEFSKILQTDKPSVAIRLMHESGILQEFIPELSACAGVEQKGFHRFDVFTHSLLVCDACPKEKLQVRLAGLFHDIGKPAMRKKTAHGDYTFYRHEAVSVELTEKILRRLRYPNKIIEQVCHLIGNHMFHYEENWTDAAVRRFIVRVGKEHIDDLFDLRQADTFGLAGQKVQPFHLAEFTAHIDKILKEDSALSIKNLAIGGKELIALGIPAGPMLGAILQELFQTVLDDPAQNTKDSLLKIAEGLYRQKYCK
ncbi:HDIG domain protein [Treponema phagedenis F0421]|nr:HDIG domain protein [Treponema phagedenis F0421]